MDKKIQVGAIVIAIVFSVLVLTSPSDPIPLPEPNSNSKNDFVTVIAENLEKPRAIAISDDRIFVTEKNGMIRVIQNNTMLESPLATFRTADVFDGGLLGIALHPNFSTNHKLYVFLTYEENDKFAGWFFEHSFACLMCFGDKSAWRAVSSSKPE